MISAQSLKQISRFISATLDMRTTPHLTVRKRRRVLTGFFHSTQTQDVSEKPKPTISVDPKRPYFYTGDIVTLTCHPKQSTAWEDVVWTINGHYVVARPVVATGSTTVSQQLSNRGEVKYQCLARRRNYTEISDPVSITVRERPVPEVTINPDNQVFRGETVTLSCAVHDEGGISDWQYSWYKDGSGSSVTNEQVYTISSVKETHTGSYSCKGTETGGSLSTHLSAAVSLTVSGGPKSTVTVTPADHVFIGEKVTLTCQIEAAGSWQYEWYRNNEKLRGVNVQKNEYIISSISESDEGNYTCKGTQSTRPTSSEISAAVRLTVSDLNGRVTIRSFTDSNKAQYFCRAGSGDPIYHTSYRDAFRGNGAVSVSGSVGAGGFVGIAVGLSLTLFFTIVLILLWFYKRNKGSGSGQNSNQDAGGDQVYESPDDFETADSTSDQGMKRGNKQD